MTEIMDFASNSNYGLNLAGQWGLKVIIRIAGILRLTWQLHQSYIKAMCRLFLFTRET